MTSTQPTATLTSTAIPFTVDPDTLSDRTCIHRAVRFDTECVLIPEPHHRSRRPLIVTKSYALPLWKKKHHPTASDLEDHSPEREVVFKVPMPSFKAAKSRSPSRAHDPDPQAQPLHSCLVHRQPSSPPTSYSSYPIPRPVRRTSLPQNLITVPLRACCPDCIHTTEESLEKGELWQEKWSRGARRRRSASLDTASPFPCTLPDSCNAASGSNLCAALPAATNNGSISKNVLAITVDEVDRRRKSVDFFEAGLSRASSGPNYIPPTNSGHDKEESVSSQASATSSASYFSDDPNAKPSFHRKSSPPTAIVEEDEALLFPLPSPRRSPSNSPKPSPSGSPRASPIPSPNSSTSSFRPSPFLRTDSPSQDSLSGSAEGSEESTGSAGARQQHRRAGRGRDERGLLTPDASPSIIPQRTSPLQHEVPRNQPTTSTPSPPRRTSSITTTTATTINNTTIVTDDKNKPKTLTFPTTTSPPGSRLPPSLSRTSSLSGSSPTQGKRPTITPSRSESLPASPPPPSSPTKSPAPHTSSPPTPSSRSTPSSPTSPPASPRARKLKPSFSLLRVGADVLKGVSSITGSP